MGGGLTRRFGFRHGKSLFPNIEAHHKLFLIMSKDVVAGRGPNGRLHVEGNLGGVMQAGQRRAAQKRNLRREFQAGVVCAQNQLFCKHGDRHAGNESHQQPPEFYVLRVRSLHDALIQLRSLAVATWNRRYQKFMPA